MSNLLDFQRLSNFVGGIVDRKIYSVSMSLTSADGYLQGLVNAARDYSNQSLQHSQTAASSASDADTAAASSLIVFNEFTSTYVGLKASDPNVSGQGNPINVGAFYIRQADGRLRYASSFNGAGQPVWVDATVSADAASILTAGQGVFLGLNTLALQTVKSPVTFQGTLTVPRVSSWSSNQPATAVDVDGRVTIINNSINAEITRATNAENSLNNTKLSKTGDTMSGPLQIVAGGNNSLFRMKNSDPSGRQYRFYSASNGYLYLGDETAGRERLQIGPDGGVGISGGLSAAEYLSSPTMILNRGDGNDQILQYQQGGVSRWIAGRSAAQNYYYVARFNSSGVYIDTPLRINESDGSIYQNGTSFNASIGVTGFIRSNATGARLELNHSSGSGDPGTMIMVGGIQRWYTGRSQTTNSFYINRFNTAGAYQDTPFRINESDGWVVVNNLHAGGALNAAGSMTTDRLYVTSNNQGRNIAIGDDAWIGDNAVPDGFNIRGQGNFNAGFVQFGNSGISLGCNANDGTLRYGGQPVIHAGNIGTYIPTGSQGSGNAYTTWSGGNANFRSFWCIRPDGFMEQWGLVTGDWGEQDVTVNFVRAYTDLESVNIQLTYRSTGANSWNDMGVYYAFHNLGSFTAGFQAPSSGNRGYGFMWRAIGK